MLFAVYAVDKPGALDLRWQTRPAHGAYQSRFDHPVGGPLLDENGDPCGSLIIMEAADLDAAHALMADDPYVRAGLFERLEIRQFTPIDWPV